MTHQAGMTAAPDGAQLIQTPPEGNARHPHTSSGADGFPHALYLLPMLDLAGWCHRGPVVRYASEDAVCILTAIRNKAVASSTKQGTFGRSA